MRFITVSYKSHGCQHVTIMRTSWSAKIMRWLDLCSALDTLPFLPHAITTQKRVKDSRALNPIPLTPDGFSTSRHLHARSIGGGSAKLCKCRLAIKTCLQGDHLWPTKGDHLWSLKDYFSFHWKQHLLHRTVYNTPHYCAVKKYTSVW